MKTAVLTGPLNPKPRKAGIGLPNTCTGKNKRFVGTRPWLCCLKIRSFNLQSTRFMKRFLSTLFICPLLANAQSAQPRFENDTLHTSSGYTIYKGRVLQLGNGTSDAGYFRFVKFHTSMIRNDTYVLQNSSILVKGLRNYKTSSDNKHSIRITGTATLPNKSTMEVDFFLTFDKAIRGDDGAPAELIVPEAFRNAVISPMVAPPAAQQAPVETKKPQAQPEVKKQAEQPETQNRLVADEIKKLFDLYKAGALTKEEYEARKKKLLEQW